ncbi:MAG: 3-oxoadipate enol-lactonase [Solirubrobacteraceae bacterium]|jgi:3-oxoadipate enol-lactonase|nr:3-oxoadipate enol-lactonase [Solirubrobacteraceae bacterium]
MSVELHHSVEGPEGAPVLLLGGALGTDLSVWDPQVPALAESLRVVRFDHRGHGRSPVPPGPYEIADLAGDVLALMARLGVQRAHWCGLSLGAMVGLWLAANAPEHVDRLVVMCTSAHMAPASAWAQRAAAVLDAGTTAAVADRIVDRWLTPAHAAAHPEERRRLRDMLVSMPPDGYAACCGAIERMDLRDDLPRIAAPTLVIAGAGDLATPPEHQRLIAGAIPGARLEVVADAAHIAAVQQPQTVNRLILDHLEAG